MKNKKIGNHISTFHTIFIFGICWNIPRWNGKTFHFLVISITFRCEILNHNDFFWLKFNRIEYHNSTRHFCGRYFEVSGRYLFQNVPLQKSSQFFFLLFGSGGDRQQLKRPRACGKHQIFLCQKPILKSYWCLEKNSTSLKCRWLLW